MTNRSSPPTGPTWVLPAILDDMAVRVHITHIHQEVNSTYTKLGWGKKCWVVCFVEIFHCKVCLSHWHHNIMYWLIKKLLKRCSTLFAIKEMQIKPTMRYYFIPTGMAIIKMEKKWEWYGELKHSCIADENVKRCSCCGENSSPKS